MVFVFLCRLISPSIIAFKSAHAISKYCNLRKHIWKKENISNCITTTYLKHFNCLFLYFQMLFNFPFLYFVILYTYGLCVLQGQWYYFPIFYFISKSSLGFPFLHSLSTLVICWLVYNGHYNWCKVVSHCGFNLHLSDGYWCWGAFHMFLGPLWFHINFWSVSSNILNMPLVL